MPAVEPGLKVPRRWGPGGDLLPGRFGRVFRDDGVVWCCVASARRGSEPAETVDEAFGFGFGGESFGEQLLVALRVGERVDQAGVDAAVPNEEHRHQPDKRPDGTPAHSQFSNVPM
jgi:hypothetical protein